MLVLGRDAACQILLPQVPTLQSMEYMQEESKELKSLGSKHRRRNTASVAA